MVPWMRLVAMGLKGRSRFQRNLPIRIDRSTDCSYIENEGGWGIQEDSFLGWLTQNDGTVYWDITQEK